MARLARLQLADQEVEPMARELSAVLDHIAKIGELDLSDVPPTSHVVEISGALRADEPRPCLPREVVLSQPSHPAWQLLDRARVEALLASEPAALDTMSRYYAWRLATVFGAEA